MEMNEIGVGVDLASDAFYDEVSNCCTTELPVAHP